uniref:Uncharacterized protein n=1 Tax=Arundo donax TaxID=35708 RepID=A0A0A9EUF2_ARUDO
MLLRTVLAAGKKICRLNFGPLSIICQNGKCLRSSTFQRWYSE